MSPSFRRIARAITPVGVIEQSSRRHATRFDDSFATWREAEDATDPTDWATVADRVVVAMAAARRGEAAFERDGVAVLEPDARWPVLALLLRQAARDGGRLHVVDFGGSLGSFYWQHAQHLSGLDLRWAVVEQPVFVERARHESLSPVTMHESIEEAAEATEPSVVLLSSVLQYLADPHDILRRCSRTGARCIVVDRTTMTSLSEDRPSVQTVPGSLYRASYPAWLLSEDRLLSCLPDWTPTSGFAGLEPDATSSSGVPVRWRGLALEPTT